MVSNIINYIRPESENLSGIAHGMSLELANTKLSKMAKCSASEDNMYTRPSKVPEAVPSIKNELKFIVVTSFSVR
jgi:hypothetical protein